MKRNAQIHKRKIADLKEHPRQHELVGDLPEHKLAAIAADMKKHGLEHPVEILADGTIVAGHQRVLAAKLLGWTEIDVVVRTDLEEAGDAAVLAYLIRDNLYRRQMTGLALAHAIQALMEVQEGRNLRVEQVKAEIGKQLNLDVRSVNRYLLLLRAVKEVQQFYEQGKLSLTDAGKVAQMAESTQRTIAERIRNGEAGKAVLADYLRTRTDASDGVGGAFTTFTNAMRRGRSLLSGRVPEIWEGHLIGEIGGLEATQKLIESMLKRATACQRKTGKQKDAA